MSNVDDPVFENCLPRPEQESGIATDEICRKHGISSATFYTWKAKHGGFEVSDARKWKVLADENAKLKKQ